MLLKVCVLDVYYYVLKIGSYPPGLEPTNISSSF